jgi:hypothetical protein
MYAKPYPQIQINFGRISFKTNMLQQIKLIFFKPRQINTFFNLKYKTCQFNTRK